MLTTLLRAGGSASDAPDEVLVVAGGLNRKRRINLKYYQYPLSLFWLF